ncbi:MAG: hypothetical protein IKQ40_06720 [Lachnospiraceae bacterium]|nr:hypothetical protein [Lachnospiraceae bacterium]
MKKKRTAAIVMTALLALCMCVPAFAEDIDSAGNVFESGETVSLPSVPFFGGFIAGRTVGVAGSEAKGSVMAAGQDVNVSGSSVGESLYVAGNNVTVSLTAVEGNLWAAGNNVTIGEGTSANGVYAAGTTVNYQGTSNGFFAAGTNVILAGTVNGDVTIEADKVQISDNAVVTGKLTVKSANDPELSENAQIGDYSHDVVTEDEEDAGENISKTGIMSVFANKLTSCLYWIAAMAAFGMLLCWFFNDDLEGALTCIKEKPGAMIGCGIVSWICIPIVAITLCCSYLLAPVAGILTLAYILILCVGLAFTGASLARLVFPKMNVFLSALIGIAVLEILRVVPVLGFIIGAAADMYLLGYVILKLWNGRLRKNVEPVYAEPLQAEPVYTEPVETVTEQADQFAE